MICSEPKLADKHEFLKKTLLRNGYPENVITNTMKYKCRQFFSKLKCEPERFLGFLRLPWIGNASMQLLEQIKRSTIVSFRLNWDSFLNLTCYFLLILKTVWLLSKKVFSFSGLHANAMFAI